MIVHEGQYWFLKGYNTGRVAIPPIKNTGIFAYHYIELDVPCQIRVQFCNSGCALLLSRTDASEAVFIHWRVKVFGCY